MKLKYDEPLSSFAFKFNLHRYTTGATTPGLVLLALRIVFALGEAVQVDPITPTLKAPGSKRLKLEHD